MAGITNKLDFLFLLNKKKFLITVAAWIASVILHNLVYGLFQEYFDTHGGDEPYFFILAIIIIPLYAIIAFIYSVIKTSFRKKDSIS